MKKGAKTYDSQLLAVSLVKKENLPAFGAFYTSMIKEEKKVDEKKVAIVTTPDPVSKALAGDLVQLDKGALIKAKATKSPKYYVLYYSAYWCPPCRAAAPSSVKI